MADHSTQQYEHQHQQQYEQQQPYGQQSQQQQQYEQQQPSNQQSQQQPPPQSGRPPNAFEKGFERTMAKAHPWFDKHRSFFDKVGAKVNNLSNKVGAEAFWPTTLDKESDKAARILRSFCIDGFEAQTSKTDKRKSLQKIPPEVIRKCKGLAIFTVMRTGLHLSGAGGSGVLVKKMPNGRWSPPSAIVIHTLGLGIVAGADIYDCVAVINTDQGMEGFTGMRATIGGEVSAAVGPLGAGKQLETEIASGRQAAVWTYTKSRGLYVGVQIDGTVIAERMGENGKFYGKDKIRHAEILSGQYPPRQGAAVQLWETLQAAEGLQYDANQLPPPYEPTPGDYQNVVPPTEGQRREFEENAYPEEKAGHVKS